jgi:hypothetical protein
MLTDYLGNVLAVIFLAIVGLGGLVAWAHGQLGAG